MLTKLTIDGFRLWVDTTFTFHQGIPTVLIGPNGSGKSTVLEVLAFLSTIASEGLRAAAYEARGGPDDFFRAGADRVRLVAWLASGRASPRSGMADPFATRCVSYARVRSCSWRASPFRSTRRASINRRSTSSIGSPGCAGFAT